MTGLLTGPITPPKPQEKPRTAYALVALVSSNARQREFKLAVLEAHL